MVRLQNRDAADALHMAAVRFQMHFASSESTLCAAPHARARNGIMTYGPRWQYGRLQRQAMSLICLSDKLPGASVYAPCLLRRRRQARREGLGFAAECPCCDAVTVSCVGVVTGHIVPPMSAGQAQLGLRRRAGSASTRARHT